MRAGTGDGGGRVSVGGTASRADAAGVSIATGAAGRPCRPTHAFKVYLGAAPLWEDMLADCGVEVKQSTNCCTQT